MFQCLIKNLNLKKIAESFESNTFSIYHLAELSSQAASIELASTHNEGARELLLRKIRPQKYLRTSIDKKKNE